VIKLAAGTPGGRWQQTSLNPPAGADLLLPALGLLSTGGVRLLCAVHTRSGDRLGYDWAGITLTGHGPSASSPGLAALTQAPSGPGFFEIGEELALTPTQGGLLTAVVVAGQDGAALETATFSAPPASAPPDNAGTPASRTHSPGTPGTSGHAAQVPARQGPRMTGRADPPPQPRCWPRQRCAVLSRSASCSCGAAAEGPPRPTRRTPARPQKTVRRYLP